MFFTDERTHMVAMVMGDVSVLFTRSNYTFCEEARYI